MSVYTDNMEKILKDFITDDTDRQIVIESIEDGKGILKSPLSEKFDRIQTAESILLTLETDGLMSSDIFALKEPKKDTYTNIVKSVHKICSRRYESGGYFPNFSLLGALYSGEDYEAFLSENGRVFIAGI